MMPLLLSSLLWSLDALSAYQMPWKAFYFLKPDFSKLTSAGLLYALGQSFFALSLGVTAMLTYASYLDKKTNLVQSGFIVAMNISVSIMAGQPFSQPCQPSIFSQKGTKLALYRLASTLWQDAFWNHFLHPFPLVLLFATVTSSVVMLEINVGISPIRTTASVPSGVPFRNLDLYLWNSSALSHGVMANVHIFGKTFFDAMDFLVSNLLMPFGASAFTFTGYIFKRPLLWRNYILMKEHGTRTFQVWLLRFIIPIIIIVVFIAQFM